MVEGGEVEFIPDPAAIDQLLRSESGDVVRYLMTVGQQVKQRARDKVGVSEPDPVPRREPHRPGTLRDSIVVRLGRQGGEPAVMVGTFAPTPGSEYALFHHEGANPHRITPRSAPRLVFYWPKVGAVVFARSVNHPGNAPNRYLTDALREVMG